MAGSSGIILINQVNNGEGEPTGIRFVQNFPVTIIYGNSMLGISILDIMEDGNVTIFKIFTDVIAEPRINKNIIAETDHGDESKVIMIGAHLDSVLEGPGIQDNPSGSSAALDLLSNSRKKDGIPRRFS